MTTPFLPLKENSPEDEMNLREYQRAMLNILEDFSEEKRRFASVQTATLNILEDFDLERAKVTAAYRQTESANKELAEFAYAASHDLKAPLRVIDNASKWLEEDLQEHLTDEMRENMNLLRGRIGRMEKLLDDLLDYSRIGRTADERCAEVLTAAELIDDVLQLLSPPENFTINVHSNLADIRVNRMPLQQVMMNLIGNALKHHDKTAGCVEVTGEDRGSHFAFEVNDDGPGIAEEFHNLVFKMFQTLKPRDQVEGSGMGLAIVRKNVEIFGGTLSLHSSGGRGSSFRFTWPKHQRARTHRE